MLKIAVTGEIRSGKDTVCAYIQQEKQQPNNLIKTLYFAEGIEMIIRKFFPEAFAGNSKPRKHYQEIGQFLRTLNPEVWVNHTKRVYRDAKRGGYKSFLCTDLRQMNEYEWLKSQGFTVIKVECEPEVRIERMKNSGDKFDMNSLLHPVEQQIKDLPYDYLITNNTTLQDLYEQIDYIIEELQAEQKEGVRQWGL